MDSKVTGSRSPISTFEEWGLTIVLGVFLAVVTLIYIPIQVAGLVRVGRVEVYSRNPLTTFLALFFGRQHWGLSTSLILIGEVVLVAVVVGVFLYFRSKSGAGKRPGGKRSETVLKIDKAAPLMGHGPDISRLFEDAVRAQADSLGVPLRDENYPGQWIGTGIVDRCRIYGNWEDVAVDIWGPRTGKTTSRAVPLICEAPGVVVATSNKRDIVDVPRPYRESVGPVWVFDPQHIAQENPTWYWNILEYVTDAVKAKELAGIFASASRSADAKTDAHFDGGGQDLLAGLFLAAAKSGGVIMDVWRWLQDPNNDEPIQLLRSHGEAPMAFMVEGKYHVHPKQRDGYIQTAMGFCSVMLNDKAIEWVTPGKDKTRFDVDKFVRSADELYKHSDGSVRPVPGTLISLSKEGEGTAGPLVTALTVAVTQAAETYAQSLPAGRLRTPMVVVLDEAANVCRWQRLPDMYSHYGSRGIMVDTILQSWSQGVAVWGREGMNKLWSAATIRVYGGGVSEMDFLRQIADQIGDFWAAHVSLSKSMQGGSKTISAAQEKILTPAELAAVPPGRIIVMASGVPPLVAKTDPYWTRPYKDYLPSLGAAPAKKLPRFSLSGENRGDISVGA